MPGGLRGGARSLPAGAGAARRGRAATRCALFQRGGGGGAGGARRLVGHPRGAAAAGDAGRAARCSSTPGIRSHRRRFGWDGGFWLPECAYAPGLEWRLAERGRRVVLRRPERPRGAARALRPVATEAGPVALPIDWEAISWLWALDGYPSDPAYAQFAGKSLRGIRIWKVGGGAYDPAAAAAVAARRQAGEFLAAIADRLRAYSAERGRRGLIVFAIDTELIGHWWSEGPLWLEAVLAGAAAAGVRLLTVPQALEDHEPGARPLRARQLGRGQGPLDLGLAAGRRPRLGSAAAGAAAAAGPLAAASAVRPRRARRARAARRPGERLGLPRPARPGGRLRVAAGHRSTRRRSRGHRLRPPHTDPRMRSLAPD